MLDIAAMIFNSAMILSVIVRALQLNRAQPRFQSIARTGGTRAAPAQPWQRGG